MDDPTSAALLSLHRTARRVGAYAWVEARAFEVLGSWVPTVGDPVAKACVASHSRAHGWHAEVWSAALPELLDLPRQELLAPPSAELAAFFDALESMGEAGTIERLTAAFRVLVPRLVAAYGAHLSIASPVSDGPTARWLRVVLHDEVEHWREGEALLEAMIGDAASARRAAEAQGELEAVLVAAGGVLGGQYQEQDR